ncbi:hypothetical protein ACTFIZ_006947 [Dictyostelium cf. discoideum]
MAKEIKIKKEKKEEKEDIEMKEDNIESEEETKQSKKDKKKKDKKEKKSKKSKKDNDDQEDEENVEDEQDEESDKKKKKKEKKEKKKSKKSKKSKDTDDEEEEEEEIKQEEEEEEEEEEEGNSNKKDKKRKNKDKDSDSGKKKSKKESSDNEEDLKTPIKSTTKTIMTPIQKQQHQQLLKSQKMESKFKKEPSPDDSKSPWSSLYVSNIKADFCPQCNAFLNYPKNFSQHITCSLCTFSKSKADLLNKKIVTKSSLFNKSIKKEEDNEEDRGAIIDEKCPECGHGKMYFKTAQTRSADEGQTIFYDCVKCSFKFSTNS